MKFELRRLVPAGFRAQVVVIAISVVAVMGLAALLMREVIAQTEDRLVAEAQRQCEAALRELLFQYQDSLSYRDELPAQMPPEARDVSLSGLSGTVLRSYEGMAGGFLLPPEELFGIAGPASAAWLEDVRRAAPRADSKPVVRVTEHGQDLVVVAAAREEAGPMVAWTMKPLAGVRDPVGQKRRWLLIGLLLSVVLGTLASASIWLFLRYGIQSVRAGLQRMEGDVGFRLPEVPGDFGLISDAINRMADRRRELEEGLRNQDRLAALGKVVAGVAHEIRNPLNSMVLTLELLNTRISKGEATSRQVRAAIEEVHRLDRIVERLLVFGRPALDERKRQDLTPLVGFAAGRVGPQAREKGIEISVQPPEEKPVEVEVDGVQIEQVVMNLLLNAVEASPPGGRIDVRVESRGEEARVVVHDEGEGVAPEARDHLFDAFFTTRANGTGLGLAVSREIARLHGGELRFEPGTSGASFALSLPLGANRS